MFFVSASLFFVTSHLQLWFNKLKFAHIDTFSKKKKKKKKKLKHADFGFLKIVMVNFLIFSFWGLDN